MEEHRLAALQQKWEQQVREARAWFASLLQRHPALFEGKDLAGFQGSSSVPEGWQTIIDNLFSRIEAFLTPDEQRAFEPLQIKEKFGGLRFYFRLRKPRGRPVQPDGAGRDEWMSEDEEDDEWDQAKEAPPPSPPREYLRIQVGHATQYALYSPQAAYGVDLARAVRLNALRDLVREAELLTEACCIRCGAQHLPLLCIQYGYVRNLCLHCATRADDDGQVPRNEVRQVLARGFKAIRRGIRDWPHPVSFWRLIENGEVADYIALDDLPKDQHARFLPHVTAFHPQLGEVLPAETFQRLIGSWVEGLFRQPLPPGVRHITVGEYWRLRFGLSFPTLPPAEPIMPGVYESLDAMFGDADGKG